MISFTNIVFCNLCLIVCVHGLALVFLSLGHCLHSEFIFLVVFGQPGLGLGLVLVLGLGLGLCLVLVLVLVLVLKNIEKFQPHKWLPQFPLDAYFKNQKYDAAYLMTFSSITSVIVILETKVPSVVSVESMDYFSNNNKQLKNIIQKAFSSGLSR